MARMRVARMAGSAPDTLQQMGPLLAKLGFLDTSPLGWFLASTSSFGPCLAAFAAGELDDGAAARCDGAWLLCSGLAGQWALFEESPFRRQGGGARVSVFLLIL